jgi:hypothetical protein
LKKQRQEEYETNVELNVECQFKRDLWTKSQDKLYLQKGKRFNFRRLGGAEDAKQVSAQPQHIFEAEGWQSDT